MILDTNFLIGVLNGKEDAAQKLRELKDKREPMLVPPGVLYELYSGADSDEEVKRIENELNRAELTPAVEKEAAQIRKKLMSDGKPISSVDYLIAGTARHLNEKILTNDSHFDKVPEVETEGF